MKRLLFFLVIPLLFAGCETSEDYYERTYYNTEGVGYVYNKNTKEPVRAAVVIVRSSFKSNGYATVGPFAEAYYANQDGTFRIKFLKRTNRENVIGYYIWAEFYGILESDNNVTLLPNELKENSSTLNLDTLWLH
ncbi:hypothetical protein FACS189413_18150 [Bacteroidia bacterium]|nr:hypothetical protein FACS189413_18150 [Bacteroidia bacterium]